MKRLFLFLTVAAAVCCAACSDDPEVAESNLSLLEDNVTFDMFGGRSVLEITADSPWTVSCDDDWCRTNVAEGSHTKKIVLTVDQSFLPEERTTAVRFYAAGEEKHTVTVTQEKFEPILVLAENGANIVKSYYCDGFERVAAACPVPIVIAGGKKLPELDALEMAYRAIQEGAHGVDMGRNIFQSDCPAGMAQAIGKVVHGGYTAQQAFEVYQEIKNA